MKYSWSYPLLFGDSYWVKKKWTLKELKQQVERETNWCCHNQLGDSETDKVAMEYFVKGMNQALLILEQLINLPERE